MNHRAPGPWRFDKDNLNIYAKGMVAQVFGHSHNGERLANAQLIAAAPEMLDALKKIESCLNPEDNDVAAKAVRAAIAKAEGL